MPGSFTPESDGVAGALELHAPQISANVAQEASLLDLEAERKMKERCTRTP
ncbi:MAG TPA: hypothetical protein VH142_13770 [Polyangiaceae bacterium]|nr:hypothetical protein [Polyangiaceae bacterium]